MKSSNNKILITGRPSGIRYELVNELHKPVDAMLESEANNPANAPL